MNLANRMEELLARSRGGVMCLSVMFWEQKDFRPQSQQVKFLMTGTRKPSGMEWGKMSNWCFEGLS